MESACKERRRGKILHPDPVDVISLTVGCDLHHLFSGERRVEKKERKRS